MVAEQATRHVADVQFQQRVVVRRVGERIAAAPAVFQLKIDVLSGEKLQALVGRQLDLHPHHVVGELVELFHPAWQGFHHDVLGGADLPRLDGHVGQWLGAAEQCAALDFFLVLQRRGLVHAIVERAGQHLALARAAGAVAAAVGQGEAFAQCGLEDGFIVLDGECVPAGLDGDLMRHDVGLKCDEKRLDYHPSGRGFHPCGLRVTDRQR